MFEYIDDKMGKVKLINVTEARANFSKVLSDMKSYYVITKNNKPQRVVINYDEFQHLKETFEAQKSNLMPQPAEKTTKTTSDSAKKKNEVVNKGKSRVQGLLAKQFEMVNGQTSVDEETRAKPEEEVSAVATSTLENEILENESDDYFQWQDDMDLELPEPDDVLDEVETSSELSEEIFESLEEELSLQSSVDEVKIEDSHQEIANTSKVEIQTKEVQDVELTPEEKNYFDKYRKLYESFEEPAQDEVLEQPVALSDDRNQEVDDVLETLPELDEPKEEIPQEPVQQKVEHKPAPKVTESRQEEALDLGQTNLNQDNSLPSLQELLQGLNANEPVDEDDLSEQEIDHIVKRIRHEE